MTAQRVPGTMTVIGMISGTSYDAVDAGVADLWQEGEELVLRPRGLYSQDLPELLRSAALLVIGFVALNKIVHGNYLLWIQPLLALVLAGVTRERPAAVASAPAASPPAAPAA